MPSGRNWDRAKRRDLGRRGQRDTELNRARPDFHGWRTDYPDEFPVTVTYRDNTPDPAAELLGVLTDAQHHAERAITALSALGGTR